MVPPAPVSIVGANVAVESDCVEGVTASFRLGANSVVVTDMLAGVRKVVLAPAWDLTSTNPTAVGLAAESVKDAEAVLPVASNIWSVVEMPFPSARSVHPAGDV